MKTLLIVLFLVLSIALSGFLQRGQTPRPADPVERGRQVYISEGCINCHSQYIRPVGLDSSMWGEPVDSESATNGPVLIGNRRQGPDLANIGIRRSREWNRQHLISPSRVSPGSRMPSYDYLFSGKAAEDGEALLDYLNSLGNEQSGSWSAYIYNWQPSLEYSSGDPESGRYLYRQYCSQCHGQKGYGDGQLANTLNPAPRNLVNEPFLYAPENMSEGDRTNRICQTIKFGIPNTSMPGHEYLRDKEIIDLAAYLSILGQKDQ